MTEQPSGKVTIAPQVLTTIVEQTALDTAGVQALGKHPPHLKDVEGRRAASAGAEAIISDNAVFVALSVKAAPDVNILALAETLQRDVVRNIEHILGMKVAQVDVRVGDVIFSETTQEQP